MGKGSDPHRDLSKCQSPGPGDLLTKAYYCIRVFRFNVEENLRVKSRFRHLLPAQRRRASSKYTIPNTIMYVNTKCFIYPHKVLSSQQSSTYSTYIHIYRDTGDQQTDPTTGTMKIHIFRNVKVMKILTLYTLRVSSSRRRCAFRDHHQQDVPSCTLTLLITDVPCFFL